MRPYTGNEPIEPFIIPAKTVRCSATSGDFQPGGAPTRPLKQETRSVHEQLQSTEGRIALAGALVALYFSIYQRPVLTPLAAIVLLMAVLYRLDARQRRLAFAPVGLASAMLAVQLAATGVNYGEYRAALTTEPGGTVCWMLLFLAVCLFYAPQFPSYTLKIMILISLFVLGSGLLPGSAFLAVFAAMQYFLIIALGVGLAIDFREKQQAATPRIALNNN